MAYFNFRDSESHVQMACWTAHPDGDGELALSFESPIVPRIGGVFVDVKNLAGAARWYSELLGVPCDETAAEQSIYSIPVSSGAALLLDHNRYVNQQSFTEIFYFETAEFEAALAYVRSQGFELAGEPSYFPDLNEFVLLDPDGNRIVIAHMK